MNNILVSIDFDDCDQLIIDKAIELGKAFNAKLWVIHIAAPDPDFVGYDAGPQHERDFRANTLKKEHKQLHDYALQINSQGIKTESLLIQGSTVDMVIEEAKKLNADLIIIGHQEHNFFYKAFFGSVSEQIINKSKIPVMVVPV